MYFDSAYIVKFYINEPESSAVRALVRASAPVRSSSWSIIEVQSTFHRFKRERRLTLKMVDSLVSTFHRDSDEGLWTFAPVTPSMLWRLGAAVSALPADVFLGSGDAVHLLTAREFGETEIWTNDRHMLAAAPSFGLAGRTL